MQLCHNNFDDRASISRPFTVGGDRRGTACACGQCTADSFGAAVIHKLIDAYPDPIAVSDVEDYDDR